MRIVWMILAALVLAACDVGPTNDQGKRSLAIGDSMFAWNALSGRSIPHVVETGLGHRMINKARNGARMIGPGIPDQVMPGPWTHVMVTGGANDLIFRCNCSASCGPTMDKMISADGRRGIVPELLAGLRDGGADVRFVGYHRAREMDAPLRHCGPILDQYEARVAAFAKSQPGISFIDMRDVFPPGDTSFYAFDRTHPSPKGSAAMGARVLGTLGIQ